MPFTNRDIDHSSERIAEGPLSTTLFFEEYVERRVWKTMNREGKRQAKTSHGYQTGVVNTPGDLWRQLGAPGLYDSTNALGDEPAVYAADVASQRR